jgi:hypothetical protein
MPPAVLARASALHEALLTLRTELPRTAFAAVSPELYADDVVLVAETGEVLVEVYSCLVKLSVYPPPQEQRGTTRIELRSAVA